MTLIEEPQAAFYAWLQRHEDDWQQQIAAGQKILVCDIGGGTSDFTLIRVRPSEATGDVQFHRIAVGEHLILGGDNLDLALARHIERRLAGGDKLAERQWDTLVRTSRRVKETLLSSDAPVSLTVNLPAAGSQVIGGGLQVEVSRTEMQQLLVEGFLPRVALTDKPAQGVGFSRFWPALCRRPSDDALSRGIPCGPSIHGPRLAESRVASKAKARPGPAGRRAF